MLATVPSSSPQHCMICMKLLPNRPGPVTVGVAPVHVIDTVWLVNCSVWFTVNATFANAPRPFTVFCDAVVGCDVSVPRLPSSGSARALVVADAAVAHGRRSRVRWRHARAGAMTRPIVSTTTSSTSRSEVFQPDDWSRTVGRAGPAAASTAPDSARDAAAQSLVSGSHC